MLTIYADLRDLKALPEKEDYLFYNYTWKTMEDTRGKRMYLSFPDEQYVEAHACYGELRKLCVPKLSKNWDDAAQSQLRAHHQEIRIQSKTYLDRLGKVTWGYRGEPLSEAELLQSEVACMYSHIENAEGHLDYALELINKEG